MCEERGVWEGSIGLGGGWGRDGAQGWLTQSGKRPADIGDLLGVAVPRTLSQRFGKGRQEALQGAVGTPTMLQSRICPHGVGEMLPAEPGAWGPCQPLCDLTSDSREQLLQTHSSTVLPLPVPV